MTATEDVRPFDVHATDTDLLRGWAPRTCSRRSSAVGQRRPEISGSAARRTPSRQTTRPQTIGYSLVDSPVGLLAWVLDKFAEWTDDGPFERVSRDRVLDDDYFVDDLRGGVAAVLAS